jgi:hypothetical protein
MQTVNQKRNVSSRESMIDCTSQDHVHSHNSFLNLFHFGSSLFSQQTTVTEYTPQQQHHKHCEQSRKIFDNEILSVYCDLCFEIVVR